MDALDAEVPAYRHTYDPLTLERLCIDCLIKNNDLWSRICNQPLDEEFIDKSRNTPSVFPTSVANRIFECFIKPLERVTHPDIASFCNAARFQLTRIHLTVPVENNAALKLLEAHTGLRELVITDCGDLQKEFVIKVLERGDKLTVLHLGNVGRMLADFCKWLEGEGAPAEDVTDADNSANRELAANEVTAHNDVQSTGGNSDAVSQNATPWILPSLVPGRNFLDAASLDSLMHAIRFPALRYFAVHCIPPDFSGDAAFDQLIARFATTLTHIDLSSSPLSATDFGWLKPLSKLRTLILFNCFDQPLSSEAIDTIACLVELRRLDISRCALDDEMDLELPIAYDQPDETLSRLVATLPRLSYLDISGTNLAGRPGDTQVRHQVDARAEWDARLRRPAGHLNSAAAFSTQEHNSRPSPLARPDPADADCPIRGLAGRHLEFLGLFACAFDACRRDRLPARRVAGTRDEQQLICALNMYRQRADSVRRVLDALFNLYRSGQPVAPALRHDALHAVLDAMRVHQRDRLVLISGSATLFYLVQTAFTENRDQFDEQDARTIIMCLVTAGERFETDSTMIRNTCLTICKFRLPEQVMFIYERLVKLLLRVAKQSDHENFPQRVSVFLLNVLACNVDDREKQLLGELGTVECMLDIIRQKLAVRIPDDVLDTCWSVLWNITDETPSNCRRFIDYRNHTGLQIFSQSLDIFAGRPELLRNCMGLMGNVAEVKQLRQFLMSTGFIERFDRLLFDSSDGIEIAYNSAGVLSNILSDGPEVWHISKPSREKVSENLISVLSTWDLRAERNINYRSFEPILRLVADFRDVAAQAWSVWALCNLTGVYPDKYCHMLKSEESLVKLAKVVANPTVKPEVRQWADETLQRVLRKVYDSKPPDCVTRELSHCSDAKVAKNVDGNANGHTYNGSVAHPAPGDQVSDDEQFEDAQSHL